MKPKKILKIIRGRREAHRKLQHMFPPRLLRRRTSRTGRKRRRLFKPGYDRTGGYYGRFTGHAAKRTKRTQKTEKKFYDMTAAQVNVTTTASFLTITGAGPVATSTTIVDLIQGSGASQRVGRRCTITDVLCRLLLLRTNTLSASLTGEDAGAAFRVIVYLDKQANGGAAAATDILQTDALLSFRNLANNRRFSIIADKILTFNTGAVGAGDGATNDTSLLEKNLIVQIAKKVFIPVEYSSTLGALAEIRSNMDFALPLATCT